MNKLSYFLISLFLLTHFLSSAQITIIGKVIDGESKEPILYATVYLPDLNTGTITNEYGDFSLYISDTLKNSILRFSCIGYNNRGLLMREIVSNPIITLWTKKTFLEEVDIVSFSEDKMEKVLSHITHKYRGKTITKDTKIFCAIETQDYKENIPLEIIEAFYTGKVSLSRGVNALNLKNGRIAINTTSSDLFMNLNITDILCRYSVFEKGSLNGLPASPFQLNSKKILNHYSLSDNGILYEDAIPYRSINFSSKEPQKCIGNILLNDSLEIIKKVELQYQNINNSLFLPLNKNDKIDSLNVSMEYYYKVDQRNIGQMLLERVNLCYTCLYFQSVSGKWRHIKNETFLLCYDYENLFESPIMNTLSLSNDYMRIMSNPYNVKFWEVNYFIANDERTEDRINFLKNNGLLLNFSEDMMNAEIPFITNNFIEWGEKRLQLTDFHNNSNQSKYNDSFNYQDQLNFTSDLYHFDIQIYLDFFDYKGKCGYTTKTMFNMEQSYCLLTWNILLEMYINLYFDMYEVARKKIVKELEKLEAYDKDAIIAIYNNEMEKLQLQIKQFNKETKYGIVQEALLSWEEIIREEFR